MRFRPLEAFGYIAIGGLFIHWLFEIVSSIEKEIDNIVLSSDVKFNYLIVSRKVLKSVLRTGLIELSILKSCICMTKVEI